MPQSEAGSELQPLSVLTSVTSPSHDGSQQDGEEGDKSNHDEHHRDSRRFAGRGAVACIAVGAACRIRAIQSLSV